MTIILRKQASQYAQGSIIIRLKILPNASQQEFKISVPKGDTIRFKWYCVLRICRNLHNASNGSRGHQNAGNIQQELEPGIPFRFQGSESQYKEFLSAKQKAPMKQIIAICSLNICRAMKRSRCVTINNNYNFHTIREQHHQIQFW